MSELQAMSVPRGRWTIRRLMVAVAASAAVGAVLDIFHVPPDPGFVYGTAACLAIVGIAYLAEDTWDFWSALAAVACGIVLGASGPGPCTPTGVFGGAIVGYLTRVATRRRFRKPISEPNPASIPGTPDHERWPAVVLHGDNDSRPRIDRASGLWDDELDW